MKTTIKFKSLKELVEDSNFKGYSTEDEFFYYEDVEYSLSFLGKSYDLLLEQYSNIDDEWYLNKCYFSPKILKQISNYDGYLPSSIKNDDGEEFTVNINKKTKKVKIGCQSFPYSEAKKFMNTMLEIEGYNSIK